MEAMALCMYMIWASTLVLVTSTLFQRACCVYGGHACWQHHSDTSPVPFVIEHTAKCTSRTLDSAANRYLKGLRAVVIVNNKKAYGTVEGDWEEDCTTPFVRPNCNTY